MDGPAVRLFLDRARAADPELAAGPRLLRRVGDICRALDGLPLAIELAAARVGTLTVDDLADRLDARFDLLRTGRRGGDSRHQTLRAVVDWSFELLGADEQRLFLRLSVFAASVRHRRGRRRSRPTTTSPPAGSPTWWPSWPSGPCSTRPGASGVGRYRMLETLRAYAADRLPADEADRVRSRHASFMVDLAERAEAGLYGPDEQAWAHRVEQWLDDLRAAWGWARDAGQVDLAVRLAAAITRYGYWRVQGDLLAWGSWVAANVPAHPRLAVAHAGAAAAAWLDGRLEEASDLARRGIEAAGGPASASAAAPLEALGDVAMLAGDLAAALEAYRAVATLAAAGRPGRAGRRHRQPGPDPRLRRRHGRPAPPPKRRSRRRSPPGTRPPSPWPGSPRARRFADADPARASAALDEAMRRAREVGNRFVAGAALTAMVALRGRHGPPEAALSLFRDAVDHWRANGNRSLLVVTLRNLVVLLARTGRDESAASLAATLEEAAAEPPLRRRGGPDHHRPRRRAAPPRRGRLRPRLGGRGGPDPRGGCRRCRWPARRAGRVEGSP